jgi:hypothetical protein
VNDNCPHCGTSLIGDPIPAEHREHKPDHDEQVARSGRCFCLPYGDATHFRRVMGHEVRGIYDGVLYWSCPDCRLAWPRWTDGLGRLTVIAAEYVVRHNEVVRGAA